MGAKISRVWRAMRLAFGFRYITQSAHVVEPVGEFDHHHTDIFTHCQEGLAQCFLGKFGFAAALAGKLLILWVRQDPVGRR